ncbi:hypothetical protein FRC02_010802 [Tulasnella sp. 418]|nr:hypothetical protein FRC02_010802 [Tulasnella sp. 418]
MTTTANPKAAHYRQQLHSVLCRGDWAEPEPAKNPGGYVLAWDELLRKYRKHCKDDSLAIVALQTQSLSLLLLSQEDGTQTSSLTPSALDGDRSPDEDALSLNLECMLQEERRGEAASGLEALSTSELDKDDPSSIRLIQAYHSYALKDPKGALKFLSEVNYDIVASFTATGSFMSNQSAVHSPLPSSAGGSLGSASGLSALESALSRTGTIAGAIGITSLAKRLEGEVSEGRAWAVIERIRGRCIEGMSQELLHNYPQALEAYDAGTALLDRLSATRALPQSSLKMEHFKKFRELWRWTERLLWRAVVIAGKIRPISDTMRFLRLYNFYGGFWPPTFRTSHRVAVGTLHLRALALLAPTASELSGMGSSYPLTREVWRQECRTTALDLKAVLEVSTSFPRAGETNQKVLDFVDHCFALWERNSSAEEDAGWVVDVMWWATKLTFHSHRILRHLSRLLVMQNKRNEAKRTFKLYVQLVSKARQTSAGEVNLQLRRRSADEPPAHPSEIAQEDRVPHDMDDDRTFIENLVWGALILVKQILHHADAKEVESLTMQAREVLDEAGLSDDKPLHARVRKAQGIASIFLSIKDPDARARPQHQTTALEHLRAAAELDPSSASTFYHLAIALAETRDIDEAIVEARRAVELLPTELRAWHLLGLLLTAKGDWNGAKVILDLGLDNGEDIEDTGGEDERTLEGTSGNPAPGVFAKDFVQTGSQPQEDSGVAKNTDTAMSSSDPVATPASDPPVDTNQTPLLIPTTSIIPPASTLHSPVPDIPQQRRAEKFEASLQLRITQLALMELVDGAEAANLKWPDVFAYFSERHPGPTASEGESGTHDSFSHSHSAMPTSVSDPPTSDGGTQELIAPPRIGDLIPPTPTESIANGHHETDHEKSKRLSHRVLHRSQRQMHSLGRKMGMRDVRLKRSRSASDLRSSSSTSPVKYHASSIHSRSRFTVKSYFKASNEEPIPRTTSPPPMPPPVPALPSSKRATHETRLLSDLWLTSAATFRRMGKLEQAKGAIQEAEVLDEENPGVWIQLGLYHAAQNNVPAAIESLHKALVLEQDHTAALVHLAQQYLTPPSPTQTPPPGHVDLAAGLLTGLTQGPGWDVPEAWYFLAKACGLRGQKERERECLIYSLKLQETRCVRALGLAVPRAL